MSASDGRGWITYECRVIQQFLRFLYGDISLLGPGKLLRAISLVKRGSASKAQQPPPSPGGKRSWPTRKFKDAGLAPRPTSPSHSTHLYSIATILVHGRGIYETGPRKVPSPSPIELVRRLLDREWEPLRNASRFAQEFIIRSIGRPGCLSPTRNREL
jgi:hypothetical protein